MTPDPRWLPFLKMTFGFLLLVILGLLAGAIALGKVESSTSFGLEQVLGGLLVLAGGFANWAYNDAAKADSKENKDSNVDKVEKLL